jgi:hypothetical protein
MNYFAWFSSKRNKMYEERLVEICCHEIVVLCDFIEKRCLDSLLDLSTTSNSQDYNSLFHTVCLQFTTACTESFHLACPSPVLWYWLPTADFPIHVFPNCPCSTGTPIFDSHCTHYILKCLLLSLVTVRCF